MKELNEKQKQHLENVEKLKDKQHCLHDGCPDCFGTGVKEDGSPCIHWISCPCPKCTPKF